ncbi:PDDEXK-like family protein [Franconibacter daqui]|uniref:hypothetical protein n=1 Tax=Franconibacter daqui TaxID=2047724 RepID=UPI002DB935CA|nr:hypothetical protein [Franconibacter daqui]MEB5922768.1 hypothetical protein [Franconibacter daqui]
MSANYVSELEMGKCGEYYAIFKLVKQGFICFPSDQGLPYDIVVEVNGRLLKGQVRSTLKMRDYGKSKSVYRFGTRTGKGYGRAASTDICDFYAFVVIDEEKIAFMSTSELASAKNPGTLIQTMEFRSSTGIYPGRIYSNGTQRMLDYSRNIESYEDFNRIVSLMEVKKCRIKNTA